MLSGFFIGCNQTRFVPEGKYLLVKNIVKADSSVIEKEKFESLIKQKPNRKFLIFKVHLWLYSWGSSDKDSTKFKKWLRSIGEEPSIVDSALTEKSKEQIKLYLNKNGFFNATVDDSLAPLKRNKKKARVYYDIHYDRPYTIRSINYSTQDTGISKYIDEFKNSSLLVVGDRYSEELISKERERITNSIKDSGYYFFSRNYITFQVDSSLGNHEVDIYLYLNRIHENVNASFLDNQEILDHQSYRIRNIYIQTDFDPKNPNPTNALDTTLVNGYFIISKSSKHFLRDVVLTRNIFVKSGDRYYQSDLDYTYRRLQELNLYKFINLKFNEVPRSEEQPAYLLDLNIQLTQMLPLEFTTEVEATNTGGNIGVAGSVGYKDKNLFNGAEVLDIRFKGGLEAIPNFNDAEQTKRFYLFNTYEVGPEVSLGLKKLMLLHFIEKILRRDANQKTQFTLGYNYQNRPDYVRSITNISYSENFNVSRRVRLLLYFADINSVKVNLSPEFEAKLQDLNDPRLIYTYQTHLISSMRGSIIYTNKNIGKVRDVMYLRLSLEKAFPLPSLSENPSDFIKTDIDFSYSHPLSAYKSVVYHVVLGYGLPHGKTTALPFEKSFFAGGSNSIRAWNTRTLGPGSFKNEINIEQSGDIKIESSIEFRTEIIRFHNGIILESATFVDVGNVWTINEDISRPGGKFVFDNVLGEFGIGGGTGLRINFTFFILRLDLAVKLRDPALDADKRWVYPNQSLQFKDISWNIAIGYPF